MRRWSVLHSRPQCFEVRLIDTPAWAVFIEWMFDHACDWTGGRLCTWSWSYGFANWAHCTSDIYRRAEWWIQVDPATAEAMCSSGTWDRGDALGLACPGPHRMPNDPTATTERQ